jgi:hypothetical protein
MKKKATKADAKAKSGRIPPEVLLAQALTTISAMARAQDAGVPFTFNGTGAMLLYVSGRDHMLNEMLCDFHENLTATLTKQDGL